MARIAFIPIVVVASCLAPLAAGAEVTREYAAAAYALEGDELLYVERHVETWRRGRLAERSVTYEDAAGELIAEKRVRYGDRPTAPSFEMIDHRLSVRESAAVEAGKVGLFSGGPEEDGRPRTVELPEDAVIDAGFDAFLRENFSDIVGGERLEFDFAVPAARRFFRFRLVPEGEVQYRGDSAYLVRMKPVSALLRLLLDPVDLVYSRDGRLLEFRGLSNVFDEDGDRYKARIVFDYTSGGSDPVVASTGTPARPSGLETSEEVSE